MEKLPLDVPKDPKSAGLWTAIVTLPIHLLLSASTSYAFAALSLAMAGGVYIGAALAVPLDDDGEQDAIPFMKEVGIALLLFLLAWAGVVWWIYLIPLGFVFLGLRDTYHDRFFGDTPMAGWYPPMCAMYNWTYALGLALLWRYWF